MPQAEEQKADSEPKEKAPEAEQPTDPVIDPPYLEKLLTTKYYFSPIELLHLRFFYYPQSFYRYETL